MTQRVYAIIGNPIGQVRSPSVFNARFAAEGVDAVMVPLQVAPIDVASVLDGLRKSGNCGGVVVTVPHKAAAARIARQRSARVDLLGAANVLKPIAGGWSADLFDGDGFVRGLQSRGHQVNDRSVAVVGAGGAGVAIAEALLSASALVSLSDIDVARAEATVVLLRKAFAGRIALGAPERAHAIVVNATPVGMDGDPRMPFDPEPLDKQAIVAEVIMKPAVTPLLHKAVELGMVTHQGHHMLDCQVDAIWSFLEMGRLDAGRPFADEPT